MALKPASTFAGFQSPIAEKTSLHVTWTWLKKFQEWDVELANLTNSLGQLTGDISADTTIAGHPGTLGTILQHLSGVGLLDSLAISGIIPHANIPGLFFTDISGVAAPAQLPSATVSSSGAVQPDNTTITISGGVISAGTGAGPTFADNETPAGVIDGANVIFTLNNPPSPAGSLILANSGLVMWQDATGDYTLSGNVITFATAPTLGPLIAWYRYTPSAAPAIPGGAVNSGILDNFLAQPWNSAHDAGTGGTSSGTSTYISPSVGRNFNFVYTANGGQRYSLFFDLDSTSQNFCYDLEVAFTDPTQINNMELDMNQVIGSGDTVIYDCQCAHVSGFWEVGAWHPTTVAGDPQTWGISTYHHIRIFWHRDSAGTLTTYDGVEFDGVWHPFIGETGNTAQSLGWAADRLVINFQIDGASAGSGTVDAYGRNIQVWRW